MSGFFIQLPLESGGGSPSWGDAVADFASLPVTAPVGQVRVTLDNDNAYIFDGAAWNAVFSGGGGTGDVIGPASATDNALTRFNGTSGKAVQNSGVIIDDSNNVSGINDLAVSGTTTLATSLSGVAKLASGVVSAGSVSLTGEVSGVLPIANGGTNSSAALANDRLLQSSGGSIVESAAITGNRALISSALGIPTHSAVTNTELSYVSGVSSSIQTQLDGKQPTGSYLTALTGDVAATGPGSATATIQPGSVTNAKIASAAGIDLNKLAALTVSRAVVSDGSGFLSSSAATATEVGYLSGVSSALQTQIDGKLNLSGGTLTGALILAADPLVSLGAATKQYVDNLSQGLRWKEPARVASTADIDLSIGPTNGDVIDGVTLATNDRVLVKNQAAQQQNGIYIVSAAGPAARSSDADQPAELNGAAIFINEGTANADKGYVQTAAVTTFADAQTWVQNFGANLYTASGQGITLTGNTFGLQIDGTTLSQSVSGLTVATGGITNTEVSGTAGIARTKLASGNNFRLVSNDGSGVMADLAAITAARALESDANGLPVASATTAVELGYVSGVTSSIQTQLDGKEPLIALTQTRFVFTDNATGALTTFGSWSYDAANEGALVNLNYSPNDQNQGFNFQNFSLTLRPLQDSPNDSFNNFNLNVTLDPDSSGFTIGTNGQASTILNMGFNHQGTSNIGNLTGINLGLGLGNGVDTFQMRGFQGMTISGTIASGVELQNNAQMQGFYYGPALQAGVVGTNVSTQAFADNANYGCAVDNYSSLNMSPTLAEIKNNSNYTGLSLNPNITLLSGNANCTMVGLFGNVTTMGTGGFSGINFNTNFNTLSNNSRGIFVGGQCSSGTAEWIGVDVSTNAITTTGNIRGMRINVPVSLTADHSALEVGGRSSLNANLTLASSLGQIYANQIGGSITVPDATAITGTDVIFNNLGGQIDLGDATSSFTGSGVINLTNVGFVGQIIGDGDANGINYLVAGYQGLQTGTIGRINSIFSAAINVGGGTITEAVLFYGAMPAGAAGVDNWGLRIEDSFIENYVPKLAVGDMSSKKVANASVGIELDSTTKALLPSRLTTTERDALTAVDGMIIYNTTTELHEGYQNGAWTAFGATSGPFTLPSYTTTARNALTPAAGMMIYNTTVNTVQAYVAGTVNDWVDALGWGAAVG